jgi:hypothetical protein
MKLVFIFHSHGAASTGSNPPWDQNIESTNPYIDGLKTEGYFYLIHALKKLEIVDDVLILIESNTLPGKFTIHGINGYVVPEIGQAVPFIGKADIIWARGGHRTWFNFLRGMAVDHWVFLYGANTGRERWTFWHAILDDLTDRKAHVDEVGRAWIPWNKPINPDLFKFRRLKRKWDVCIGASYIHDKKGQWRTVEALIKYHKNPLNEPLKCVMPGSIRSGRNQTVTTFQRLEESGLQIERSGWISRKDLGIILNQSKIMVHGGASGQNDRGVLEALSCGCKLILSSPQHHAPITYQNREITTVSPPSLTIDPLVTAIKLSVDTWNTQIPEYISNYYEDMNGLTSTTIPQMRNLIAFMRRTQPNYEAIGKWVRRRRKV